MPGVTNRTKIINPTTIRTGGLFYAAFESTYIVKANLTKDYNKDIIAAAGTDGIQYNYLNLPSVITVKNSATINKGTITYTYDAAGNKLMKTTAELANAANNNIALKFIGNLKYNSTDLANRL